MKTMFFRLGQLMLLCALLISFVSCEDDDKPKAALVLSEETEALTETGYVYEGEHPQSLKLTFTANETWTLSVDADWLTFNATGATGANNVRISASTNTTYEERSATITLSAGNLSYTFSVQQKANLGIYIAQPSYTIDPEGVECVVNVGANEKYETVLPDNCEWIKLSENKSLSYNEIRFLVDANYTSSPRTASIKFKSEEHSAYISFIQKQIPRLSIEVDTIFIDENAVNKAITMYSSYAPSIEYNCDWMSASVSSADDDTTYSVSMQINDMYEQDNRETIITMSNEGGLSKKIIVIQRMLLKLSTDYLRLYANGSQGRITATSLLEDKTIIWTSSAPNVATVSDGIVTPISMGSTTITATAADGRSKTCSVYVSNVSDDVELSANRRGAVVINGQLTGSGTLYCILSNYSTETIHITNCSLYAPTTFSSLLYKDMDLNLAPGESTEVSCVAANVLLTDYYWYFVFDWNGQEYVKKIVSYDSYADIFGH